MKWGSNLIQIWGSADREIALMFFHHRDQHITRQRQKFFVEAAHDGGRHFDQVGHFGQQAFFDDGFTADETPRPF